RGVRWTGRVVREARPTTTAARLGRCEAAIQRRDLRRVNDVGQVDAEKFVRGLRKIGLQAKSGRPVRSEARPLERPVVPAEIEHATPHDTAPLFAAVRPQLFPARTLSESRPVTSLCFTMRIS